MTGAPAISRDLVGGVVFLAVGLAVTWLALDLDLGNLRLVGPGAIPLAVGAGMVGLSVALIVRSLRSPSPAAGDEDPPDPWGRVRVAAIVALMALFVFALPVVGFLIASFALMYVCFAIGLGRPFSVFALVAAAVTAVAAHVLFVMLLDVRLPAGLLGGL
ncbi:tripartite tricarboxylate transporter TctB family protein [Rhodoplanes sp. TEM]|uniref:Tripartite tricarboxylate transporter TctB family protein n=1 Tax=Rhodoplanes tepidamans TaxID=200616 RepID=A0ABT5J7Q9_RHOTP|nr:MULTISPECIES: tripartite tricarboxylate transporter TctB family protein [Rhodoplanes]MDC7785618.1 tripartite tricarboxylate transporter TctB family protein [Rhodoplanes tepidamans]MDC7985719.1 tripartite tricarboxylate transporter TctB family protein [Rhodoplanes sp. TEM]MDQ0354816.1 hypothetical protein [Rhodoplanes tepidamans]